MPKMKRLIHLASALLTFGCGLALAAPQDSPAATKLSQCDFPNLKKPWRIDNACKAILDDVAKNLQQNSESKLEIIGNVASSEKYKNLAALRSVNAKSYLVGGEAKQGIDPVRIELLTGDGGSQTVEFWIVPPGAKFSAPGTHPVNEKIVAPMP
jgi:hypothetical protein